jgi:hypothetical protein
MRPMHQPIESVITRTLPTPRAVKAPALLSLRNLQRPSPAKEIPRTQQISLHEISFRIVRLAKTAGSFAQRDSSSSDCGTVIAKRSNDGNYIARFRIQNLASLLSFKVVLCEVEGLASSGHQGNREKRQNSTRRCSHMSANEQPWLLLIFGE